VGGTGLGEYAISGRVLRVTESDREHTIIVGVPVSLIDGEGSEVASAETDDDGLYAFKDVAAGDYIIRASASFKSLPNSSDNGDYEGEVKVAVSEGAGRIVHLNMVRAGVVPNVGGGQGTVQDIIVANGSGSITIPSFGSDKRVILIPFSQSDVPGSYGFDISLTYGGVSASLRDLLTTRSAQTSLPPAPTIASFIDGTPSFRGFLESMQGEPIVPLSLDRLKIMGRADARGAILRESVGEVRKFFAFDFGTNSVYTTDATLRAVGNNSYVYVEDGEWDKRVTGSDVEKIVKEFDDNIYPKITSAFGYEWGGGPGGDGGVDGDGHITVFLLAIRGNSESGPIVGGYFSPQNEYLNGEKGVQFSNQREMVYLDTAFTEPAGIDMYNILAHEFQHMITWNRKFRVGGVLEDVWLDEGISMIAQDLAGYGPQGDRVAAYQQFPSASLTSWDNPQYDYSILYDYAISYMFVSYLARNYGGASLLSKMMGNDKKGVESVTASLQDMGLTFDKVFVDFVVAGFYNDLAGATPWGYPAAGLYAGDSGIDLGGTVGPYGDYRLLGPLSAKAFTSPGGGGFKLFNRSAKLIEITGGTGGSLTVSITGASSGAVGARVIIE